MRTSAQDKGKVQRPRAYALIQLADGHARDVIEQAEALPAVQSVEAIRGPYQLIATLTAEDAEPLRRLDDVVRVVVAKRNGGTGRRGVRAFDRPRRRGLAMAQPCGTPA